MTTENEIKRRSGDDGDSSQFTTTTTTTTTTNNNNNNNKEETTAEPTTAQRELLRRILGPVGAARTVRLPSTWTPRPHHRQRHPNIIMVPAHRSSKIIMTGERIIEPKCTTLQASFPILRDPSSSSSSSSSRQRPPSTGTAVAASSAKHVAQQPAVDTTTHSLVPSPAPKIATAAIPKAGVDDLLQKMNDTGKVSTIAKTAVDWEAFKTDTGLAASLEDHTESKGAFLKKKDFLDRVDQRKFEYERQVRERDRVKKK